MKIYSFLFAVALLFSGIAIKSRQLFRRHTIVLAFIIMIRLSHKQVFLRRFAKNPFKVPFNWDAYSVREDDDRPLVMHRLANLGKLPYVPMLATTDSLADVRVHGDESGFSTFPLSKFDVTLKLDTIGF
jgi:hypothetical protein